jgi:glycosyltransferase involved in cell wall biosynthesis
MTNKIDVVMLTKNSNKQWFKQVIKSLHNCPVCHLIVIDCFSTDGTIEVIKEFFPEAKVLRSTARLGEARKIGATLVDTTWFAYVDSDIELCNNWFERISKHITPMTGAIQGGYYNPFAQKPTCETGVKYIQKRESITIHSIAKKGLLDQLRGLTTCVLIKKELVDDWAPSTVLSVFEDYALSQHIVNKGHRWLIVNDIKSVHWRPLTYSSTFKDGLWNGAGAWYTKAKSSIEMLVFTPAYILKKMLIKNNRDSKNSLMEITLQTGWLLGYFCYRKNYLI